MQNTRQSFFLSCLVFLLFLLLLPANPMAMFSDPDTGWHLAAGDLIRSLKAIPAHDPWSFTADEWPWLNISWAWDAALSYVYQHSGWQGVIAANAITIAATLALVFAAALALAQDGLAAFLATLAAALILSTNVRPYQATFLLTALLSLMLSQVSRRRCSPRWLCIVPVMMAVWVNAHGGFLVAFVLLGFHALDALLRKDYRLAGCLTAVCVASLAACLINPYGIHIIDAALRTLDSRLKPYLQEWGPLTFSPKNFLYFIYILLFFILAAMRRPAALCSEQWITYFWLAMGLSGIRHLSIFGIVSAPLLAVGLRDVMRRRPQEHTPPAPKICEWSSRIMEGRAAAGIAALAAVAAALWLYTPQAAKLYRMELFNPMPDLLPEIGFLETHYPHARLFTSYSLGGPLIFYARGKIPVWIDGRAETAYPPPLVSDYIAFESAAKNWPQLFDRWRIDGAIIAAHEPMAMGRFVARPGWRLVFKGRDASIFMRDAR